MCSRFNQSSLDSARSDHYIIGIAQHHGDIKDFSALTLDQYCHIVFRCLLDIQELFTLENPSRLVPVLGGVSLC